MQLSRTKILAVGLGLALAGVLAFSQQVKPVHMHGHGMMGGDLLGRFSDVLDLTEAQQAQIKDIRAKEEPAMKPLMDQMFQGHKAMDDLVASGTFDEAKVRILAAQQAQAFQEMTVQKARIDSELVQLLTADQKAKLAAIRQKHEQRMMQHREGPPPEPPTD
jgi:Spy/CpxP family protein refolding chaperone